MEAGGTVTFVNPAPDTDVRAAVSGDKTSAIQVSNSPIRVYLNKVDAEAEDTRFAGAKFTLLDISGESGAQTVAEGLTSVGTDGGRGLLLDGVQAGHTYRLIETEAPEGYVLSMKQPEFTVALNGDITVTKAEGVLTADVQPGSMN